MKIQRCVFMRAAHVYNAIRSVITSVNRPPSVREQQLTNIFRSGNHPVWSLLILFFLLGRRSLKKKQMFRRFKSDRDEICQEWSSSKYASIDGVGFWYDVTLSRWRPWHLTFQFSELSECQWCRLDFPRWRTSDWKASWTQASCDAARTILGKLISRPMYSEF